MAMVKGRTITEFQEDGTAALVRQAWLDIKALAAQVKKD